MAMEAPPPFRLSPRKDAQPLHPLSPERVHNTRPPSSLTSTSTTITKTSKISDDDCAFPPPAEGISSTHSSPARKPAGHLFADYAPLTPTASSTRGFALPQSPSLPEIHALRSHVRTNSDVQGLVKRFEHLDVRDRDAESVERRNRHEAELRRAQIAREEAESDVKRLREEGRRLRREREESGERERMVGRRLEVVMEEYASAKENYATQHAVYEKELRKSRKEAFKSSSAVLKLQEELKSTRNSLRITQSGFELEKQKVQRREQDTFNAQYQLAAVQEELDKLRAQLKIVEEEKEALKTSLKEEEVARIAAEGMIALPPPKAGDDDEDLCGSPKRNSPLKRAPSPLSDDKENMGVVSKKVLENKRLQEELLHEQMRREHAEEMLEFLGLECRFQCCRCQTAAKRGHQYGLAFAGELKETLDEIVEGMKSVLSPPAAEVEERDEMQVDDAEVEENEMPAEEHVAEVDFEAMVDDKAAQEPETAPKSETEAQMPEDDSDRSMTLQPEEAPEQLVMEEEAPMAPRPTPAEPEQQPEPEADAEPEGAAPEPATSMPIQPSSPQTPAPAQPSTPFRHNNANGVRTITTTTTVPMHFTPMAKPSFTHPVFDSENIPPRPDNTSAMDDSTAPPAFDRAAALAAIEYRRGRAKSIASGHMTPRKQMLEGVNLVGRRDISAPALGGKSSGMGYAKAAASVGRAGGKGRLV